MTNPTDVEDEYFRRVEAEKRALHRAALANAATELHTLGCVRPEVGERIHALGFKGPTAAVFRLLPLVLVAWADGAVSLRERAVVFRALEAGGHERESRAGKFLEVLLEHAPSRAYHEEAIALIQTIASAETDVHDLLQLCRDVAEASGGLLGFGSVSKKEWAVIEEVATAFEAHRGVELAT